MAAEEGPQTTSDFRDRGNDEYKKGNYLKAAALYTRALKQDPANAALFSNRSAALLHINKLTKALADANECIRLRPDWDKGHFRRGCALEAAGTLDEALRAYTAAGALSPGSRQIGDKVQAMQRRLRQQAKAQPAGAAGT